jgi:hypothetical protein
MPPGAVFALGLFSLILSGMIVVGPIGRALADRLRGKSAGATLPAAQEQLDEVLGRLEDVQRQLGEVIEHQEFTERLLAQAREKGQLGAGNGR